MPKSKSSGSQKSSYTNVPQIGSAAPEFKATTTMGSVNFPQDYKGKWVVLFSHPADFTQVCTTEISTFAAMEADFRALNTEVIGLSVDSVHSHKAWLMDIDELKWAGSKTKVWFPVIEDLRMTVQKKYGMVHQSVSDTQAVRAVFFIDPKGILRAMMYYPRSLGRNMDEIKRVIQALQKSDAERCSTPADWRPGKDVIVPGASSDVTRRARAAVGGLYSPRWYLTFRREQSKKPAVPETPAVSKTSSKKKHRPGHVRFSYGAERPVQFPSR